MQVYIKEALYVLDYDNNIVDMIFASDDHRTPGYAYNINIEEANTGYSNLSFTMPTRIFPMATDLEGAGHDEELILNPKLEKLTPLTKLRYNRQVIYTGTEVAYVQVPEGYGDEVAYIEKAYYPGEMIEDYVMDYIIQPLDKKRSGFEISIQFNAIDYPRFNLSKKKMGLTINEKTITRDDWSLYEDAPMSIPGSVQYYQWTEELSNQYGGNIPTEWEPNTGYGYPISEAQLNSLLGQDKLWSYGLTATVYWWPITKTGRENGVLYEKGDYLTLHIYPKFETGNIDASEIRHNLDFYGYQWLHLDKGDSYLTPNNPCNYLNWVLENTNWSIAINEEKDPATWLVTTADLTDEKEMIDMLPAGPDDTDWEGLYLEEGDCWMFKTLRTQTNPDYLFYESEDWERDEFFHSVEDLPQLSAEDLGKWACVILEEQFGKYYTIPTVNIFSWDGSKWYLDYADKDCITTHFFVWENNKWNNVSDEYWVHYLDKRSGLFYDVDLVETEVAKPSTDAGDLFEMTELRATLSASDSNCYNVITEMAKTFQLYPVFNCEERTLALKIFSGKNHGLTYHLGRSVENTGVKENGEKIITKLYSFGGQDKQSSEVIILGDAERVYRDEGRNPDNAEPWDPNAPEYIQKRSPYGTNYVYNFKWMYDNGWMTKEQILGLYDLNQQIQDLNKGFLDRYNTDLVVTGDEYVKAGVVYSTNQDEIEACLTSMMNTYYRYPGVTTEKFTAFPEPPADCKYDAEKKGYYLHVKYCALCGAVGVDMDTCPTSGCAGEIQDRPIHINTWAEESQNGTNSEQWNPSSKGFYQAVYEQLGAEYKDRIKIATIFPEKPLEDYDTDEKAFIMGKDAEDNDIVVYDKSGNLYNWNDYVQKWKEYYGYSLLNEAEMNRLQIKLDTLEASYKVYLRDLADLENKVQDNYGDFIIEGKFNDPEIVYPAVLLNKTMEASEKYSIPEVTYSLNVIDSSGLIEYRTPGSDTYNELVHSLHNLGQIVPRAGDYVKVYDEPMGLFGVPATITSIKRSVDNPSSNSITLDTSYTDDEEFVGNIITATNTVLNNADIYARTAVLKGDGTIDGAAMAKSLEQANGTENIAFVGSTGSVLLDSKGLLVTNPDNPDRKMKYSGSGVYGTVDGGLTYEPMLTPNGINANYISAGSIDTHKVQILSGKGSKIVLDSQGLSIKDNPSGSYTIPDGKYKTVDGIKNKFLDWTDSNLKAFIGVDYHNEAQLYLSGQMQIEGGSTIAGWNVLDDKLSSGSGSTYVGLSSKPGDDYAIWAGAKDAASAPFSITHEGKLTAQNADIKGVIHAESLVLESSIQIGSANLKDTYTYIEAEDAKIAARVLVLEGEDITIKGNITTLQGSVTNLNSSVTNINSSVTNINSKITNINSQITNITRDVTNIKSNAVTFSDLKDANKKTVISGDYITTGTIDCSTVTVTNIKADNIKSGTLKSAALSLPGIEVGVLSGSTGYKQYQTSDEEGSPSQGYIVLNPWNSASYITLDSDCVFTKDDKGSLWRGHTKKVNIGAMDKVAIYFVNGLYVGHVE